MELSIDPKKSLGEIVAERPRLIPLFERLGLDYCCGGRRTLEEACAHRGLDAKSIVQAIDAFWSAQDRASVDARDWTGESLAALCDHIVETHHRYLIEELPRLGPLVTRVAEVHGESDRRLVQVKGIFDEMYRELLDHLQKEEAILFPLIRRLEAGDHVPTGPTVAAIVRQMEREHASSGDALDALRELTGGYEPPPHACGTYRAMLTGLSQLERDLHLHIHKENNILFPRAIAREQAHRTA